MLGTNGGGFFNANSAHPFENPTPLTNMLADVLDLSDSCRALRHAGQDGGLTGPWMGGVCGDVGAVPRRRGDVLLGGGAAAIRC